MLEFIGALVGCARVGLSRAVCANRGVQRRLNILYRASACELNINMNVCETYNNEKFIVSQ